MAWRYVPRCCRALGWICFLGVAAGLPVASAGAGNEEEAPEVKLEIFPESQVVAQGQKVLVSLAATNSSGVDVEIVQLRAISSRFGVEQVRLPAKLPPLGSVQRSLWVWPLDKPLPDVDAGFGSRKILFVLDYKWGKAGNSHSSSQMAAVDLTVRRHPAEEENKEEAPAVKLEILPESEVVEQGQKALVSLTATNSSEVDVEIVQLRSISTRLGVEQVRLPARLPAFGSVQKSLRVWPLDKPLPDGDAGFGSRQILFVLDYKWRRAGESHSSSQTAAVNLKVRRKFEEETGGLLGGSTALFYLLLPILPAYLAYQVVERLRKGEGLRLPTFAADDLLTAFFLVVSTNLVFLLLPLQGSWAFDYSDPKTLAKVLAASAGLGALVPLARYLLARWKMRAWGFREDETPEGYLRKALLGRGSPRHFGWVTALTGKTVRAGILLVQPNGRRVLGPQLQVFVPSSIPDNQQEAARTTAASLYERIRSGAWDARKDLVDKVERRELGVEFSRFILCNDRRIENPPLFIERWTGEINNDWSEEPVELVDLIK